MNTGSDFILVILNMFSNNPKLPEKSEDYIFRMKKRFLQPNTYINKSNASNNSNYHRTKMHNLCYD